MNGILIFTVGFLLGGVACLSFLFWRSKTNPLLWKNRKVRTTDSCSEILPMIQSKSPVYPHDTFISQVNQLIDQNLNEPDFSVEILSKKLFLSRSQLFRKVKTRTGMSPSDLLRRAKLNKACQLLRNPELNVSQVAQKSGFKDLAHFSKSFRKEFGQNPKNLQRQMHQNPKIQISSLYKG